MHEMGSRYKLLQEVGYGSKSKVYKALDLEANENVVVKTIPYKKVTDGIPCLVIREISLLKDLDHENIVRLLDVLPTNKKISLVFESMDCNLYDFIKSEHPIGPNVIKNLLQQILRGVSFCHSQKILHRDLKPINILVDKSNPVVVKLADFGTSREVGFPDRAYTQKVGTSAYMAPELLFDCSQYSFPVDIWAVGCIFAYMVKGRLLFCGAGGFVEQYIQIIFSLLGTPDEETWPGVTKLYPQLHKIGASSPQDLAKEFQGLEPAGVDLLSKMLCLDPGRRITAWDALKHPYFGEVAFNP